VEWPGFLPQQRLDRLAPLDADRAAGFEAAAGRRIHRWALDENLQLDILFELQMEY
jgi:hypothetical protein